MRVAAFPKGDLDAMVARRTKTVFNWILQAAEALPVDGLELHTGFFWSTSGDFVCPGLGAGVVVFGAPLVIDDERSFTITGGDLLGVLTDAVARVHAQEVVYP